MFFFCLFIRGFIFNKFDMSKADSILAKTKKGVTVSNIRNRKSKVFDGFEFLRRFQAPHHFILVF